MENQQQQRQLSMDTTDDNILSSSSSVPNIPLGAGNEAKLATTMMEMANHNANGITKDDGSANKDDGASASMDISVSGSDLPTDVDGGDGDGAAVMKSDDKNPPHHSPLTSVQEEQPTSGAPSIHEHHRSDHADNDDDDDDDDDNCDNMSTGSPSRHSLIGRAKSIEEASVNTTVTVESAVMEDATTAAVAPEQPFETLLDSPVKSDISAVAEEDDAKEKQYSHHQNVNIRLTIEEERLFNLLTSAAEAYESGTLDIDPNPSTQSVAARKGFPKGGGSDGGGEGWLAPPPDLEKEIEIRVAGGWVRDKLLNQHSCDVDVALDCMMGVQFARIVQSYLAREMKREEEMDKKLSNERNGDKEMEVATNEPTSTAETEASSSSSTNNTKKKKKKKNGKANKDNNGRPKQPKIGVIGANPSQSKHLETATMNVHGMDVDFVNLRAEEVYELNSRIPTSDTRMFGSPLEDALRRDFTINSLFYNVRTRRIEDWTGRGLDDLLVHRRIVTPVDPHVTFHDDPLRVLRAVRFAVRLDFELDQEIIQAAMSKRVHHSLHVKVSRERVGKELEGMLTGKHARPGRALDMIAELHLGGSVFAFPGSFPAGKEHGDASATVAGGPVTGRISGMEYNCSLGHTETETPGAIELAAKHRARGWAESSGLLGTLPRLMEGHEDEREELVRLMTSRDEEADPRPAALLRTSLNPRLLHLCVFILPFHDLTFPDRKGRAVSVTAQMVKEALKFPVRDIQAVSKILSHVDEMTEILREIRSQLSAAAASEEEDGGNSRNLVTPPCRLRLGMLLRSLKEHWITCLLTAAAWEIRTQERGGLQKQQTDAAQAPVVDNAVLAEQPSRELYHAIVDTLKLDECWCIKPHLDGKAMIRELGLPKGPIVGVYLDDQTRWMLLHPDGTREQCKSHLHERKREREEEREMERNDQNEVHVGVANGEGRATSPDGQGENGSKHLSKKIRAED
eukprot:CAMPEP_0183726666 /NCGR_PEP_ID=MMETSP0737-20130205/23879_1 /TAXON_ID=385413 /ORGANISM="Thalassiosira miniscula, Strain CCMP1093" /LENGTH=965 /DNA_ID=CAMNT_0025958077 /DNA_START=248 /DNA_END=3145 /DNA_ORIENTATION=-